MPGNEIFDVLAGVAGRLWEYLAVSKPPVDVYVCDLSDALASKISKDTGTMTPIAARSSPGASRPTPLETCSLPSRHMAGS